jgi:kumamolisin
VVSKSRVQEPANNQKGDSMGADLPGHRRLENSLRPPLPGARLAGPADPNEAVVLCLVLRRRPGAPGFPGHEYWASTPPGQRKFPSRSEFAARYGAASEELAAVANFCRARGFEVAEADAARRCVVALTTVEAAARVFGVELNRYATAQETYRGYDGQAQLPPEIADFLDAVLGLDNRRLGVHASNGGGTNALTPLDVANFYKFPPNTTWTNNATGQTIGILEFGGGYDPSDFKTYFERLGIATPAQVISIPASAPLHGNASSPDPRDIEVALDVEVAGAVAQGAKIVIYFGSGFMATGLPDEQGWYSLLSSAIHDATNKPTVLSISWSAAEKAWGQTIPTISSLFQDAANLGVTVFASSGDNGASGYNYEQGDGARHVHYPASDPYVTGCGGTAILHGAMPWFEGTWNDAGGATGGGISVLFHVPLWQNAVQVNMQPLAGRGVPDIAGNASAVSSGYDLFIYGMNLSDLNTPAPTRAGTSAVAPLYAGLMALINANIFPLANIATTATSVGFLNPSLYGMPASWAAQVFNDVNDDQTNTFDGVAGYSTTAGWDPCTGWGSVNGAQLADFLLANFVAQNPGCVAAITALARAIAQALGMG